MWDSEIIDCNIDIDRQQTLLKSVLNDIDDKIEAVEF